MSKILKNARIKNHKLNICTMKVALIYLSVIYLASSYPVFANSDSAEQAEIYCHCMKNAKKTNNASEKRHCIELKAKYIQELGKSSPAYSSYVNLTNACDKEK